MATVVLTQIIPVSIPGVGTLPAQTCLGWQITPTGAQDLVTACEVAASIGYTVDAQCSPDLTTGAPNWNLLVTKANFPAQTGVEDSWILFDGTTIKVLSAAECTTLWAAEA